MDATIDDGSCDFDCIGCTDPEACNYDADATEDDGSYVSLDDCGVCGGDNSTCGGCTDPEACNYDADAVNDDESCILGGQNLVVSILTDNFGETTWALTDLDGAVVVSGGPYSDANTLYEESICVGDGCYTFTINDSFGDGIAVPSGRAPTPCPLTAWSWLLVSGSSAKTWWRFASELQVRMHRFKKLATTVMTTTENGSCNVLITTDAGKMACNYDPFATEDDGSCEYASCVGCAIPVVQLQPCCDHGRRIVPTSSTRAVCVAAMAAPAAVAPTLKRRTTILPPQWTTAAVCSPTIAQKT